MDCAPLVMDNREIVLPVPEGAELLDPPLLNEPPEFRFLVAISTWGLLVIELLLAFLYLTPQYYSMSIFNGPIYWFDGSDLTIKPLND
ncbi:MAG: hypothetical protein L0220_08710 [Acidobacteria bacterium]|nr:hypothetical protein [Acidobacteriota bacterium]